ncbi:MAG: N-acetylmuramoyl-L-alanine amidase [Hydrotalea sp.]|nr:N-acetylmuramoyl-L-alanine amidase [Hydrotalea sp.]
MTNFLSLLKKWLPKFLWGCVAATLLLLVAGCPELALAQQTKDKNGVPIISPPTAIKKLAPPADNAADKDSKDKKTQDEKKKDEKNPKKPTTPQAKPADKAADKKPTKQADKPADKPSDKATADKAKPQEKTPSKNSSPVTPSNNKPATGNAPTTPTKPAGGAATNTAKPANTSTTAKPAQNNKTSTKPIAPPRDTTASKNINLKKIEVKSTGQGAQVVAYFDRSTPYRVFTMANPPRVVMDMVGKITTNDVTMADNATTKTWLKNYRLTITNNGVGQQTRIVFDLAKNARVVNVAHRDDGKNNFTIASNLVNSKTMAAFNRESPNWQTASQAATNDRAFNRPLNDTLSSNPAVNTNNGRGNQIASKPVDAIGNIINQAERENNPPATRSQLDDLIKKSDTGQSNNASNKKQPQAQTKAQPRAPAEAESDIPKDKPLIAIDAGHGGVDTGTIGRHGTVEKLVNVAVAKQLAAALQQSGRYRVLLTRSGDYFIPLRERYRMAERAKADFFLSIHADSFPDPNVLGASIYTLSNVASDRETAKIAERENNSDKYASMFERGLPFDARVILLGLGQKQKEAHSNMFAKLVAQKFPPTVPFLRSKPHRFAAFTVMKSVTMPSVLLEVGFLSSEQQERQIISPEFRNNLTHCMVKAFDQYFYNIPMQRGCGL